MNIERKEKRSFVVIGKEGSTADGEGFIARLWEDANFHFAECEGEDAFSKALGYLKENGLALAGAVHDFTDPQTGRSYMFFPIRKI